MRKILFLSIMLLSSIVYAQDTVQVVKFPFNPDGKIVYETIGQSTLSQDKLFTNAQTYIAKVFGDFASVAKLADRTGGKIVLKGRIQLSETLDEHITFTSEIDLKPQKFRIRMSDIIWRMKGARGFMPDETIEFYINRQLNRTDAYKSEAPKQLLRIDIIIKSFLDSFKTAINLKDDF